MERQKGRHFLITGGGTGIGRAIAQRLVTEGANVTIMGRREAPLGEVASQHPEQIQPVVADSRDQAAIESGLQLAGNRFGPLHGVVANAGVGGPNQPGDDDRFDEIVEINLMGTYRTVQGALRHFADGPEPRHVVVTSSVLGRIGVPGYTGYCASKTGLIGLVRALAMELAPDAIQVNAICPGWVDTEMAWEGIDAMAQGMKLSRDEAFRRAMKPVPTGRMSTPEEVAGLVAWLVSADARGLVGQAIDINNGAWMG